MNEQQIAGKVMRWMASEDTGISSECIAQTALGNWRHLGWTSQSPPADPADLGRCLRLLRYIPELRELAFPKLRRKKQWTKAIKNWDRMADMMKKEVGIDWSKGDSAPQTYAMMKKIGL